MAAAVVSGLAADLIAAHPAWTPDQVKGAIVRTGRPLPGVAAKEVTADKAEDASGLELVSNVGLQPNTFIEAATGTIDTSRATWSRATWSTASDPLRATWSRATWSCECTEDAAADVESTRATWSRATWSRATWSTFFEG